MLVPDLLATCLSMWPPHAARQRGWASASVLLSQQTIQVLTGGRERTGVKKGSLNHITECDTAEKQTNKNHGHRRGMKQKHPGENAVIF